MRKLLSAEIIVTGLAIFSMFFGAGNLMFPLRVGLMAGQDYPIATLGFLLSATLLPLIGLIGSILFDGNYEAFFGRIGKVPGFVLTTFILFIIGPVIAMPRIVTLSHVMIQPFMPEVSLFLFTIIFLGLTFLSTYKESKIIDVLGYVISPALFISLLIIIGKGMFTAQGASVSTQTILQNLINSFTYGYRTLDLIGGIVFGSIILTILKKSYQEKGIQPDAHRIAKFTFKSGLFGTSLLAIVYAGLIFLGAYFGAGFEALNDGQLFSAISFNVLGSGGAAIIAIAVLMACYSTIIALAAIFAEYLKTSLLNNRISYVNALLLTLGATAVTSNFGLDTIAQISGPIIGIIYPSIIVLTILNIGYKLFDFKPVKLLVFATLVSTIVHYAYYL
jgi:LIVCS family branched-chain amino acid:cation transporter